MIGRHGRDGSTCDAHKCCHPTHPLTMLVPTTRLKLRMKRIPRCTRILESRFLNADCVWCAGYQWQPGCGHRPSAIWPLKLASLPCSSLPSFHVDLGRDSERFARRGDCTQPRPAKTQADTHRNRREAPAVYRRLAAWRTDQCRPTCTSLMLQLP